MIDVEELEHNPLSEKIVQYLQEKTGSNNPNFFRVHVAYYLAKVASMMRCSVRFGGKTIPVNVYAINLAPSGFGKGYSTSIMDQDITGKFKKVFRDQFFPEMARRKLAEMAQDKAIEDDSMDEETWMAKFEKDFDRSGALVTEFDSGTVPAIKQLREKLLVAKLSSINFEMDEIGSNLLANQEVLTACLELFDGVIKQKLIKNTAENTRAESIDGITPTNIMLFGTPSKLLNGSSTEEEFNSMLETGYARRCFFGYVDKTDSTQELTPEELYDRTHNNQTLSEMEDIADHLVGLIDDMYCNRVLEVTKEVEIRSNAYKIYCKRLADALPDHEEVKKAEMTHRFFKAVKLAGAYAFVDGAEEVEMDHLNQAIKLTEESGEAFHRIMHREKNYVRLAKYIVEVGSEVTQVDLDQSLQYFTGTAALRKQMLTYAISWAYGEGILIKRIFRDSIELFKGEALEKTDLEEVSFSYSDHYADDYEPCKQPFNELHNLTQAEGMHWSNHCFKENHRKEANTVPGFNMVVLDIDGGASMDTVQLLMKDFTYLIHTTKSHGLTNDKNKEGEDRFRLILPLSHNLKMEKEEYGKFLRNIYEWLPFKVDVSTVDRCRKWETFDGEHFYNDGKLIDVFDFIPDTARCNKLKEHLDELHSFNAFERWFIDNTGDGNRNNQLLKFAMALVDLGEDTQNILARVMNLNSKIQDPLPEEEIHATVMKTVYQRGGN